MARFLEHIGLNGIFDDEEMLMNLIGTAAHDGKPLMGYYGNLYFSHHIGWAQIIVNTELNKDEKAIEIVGYDTHADGNCNWNVRLHELDLNDKEDKHTRRCVVTREDGTGMTVINIVCADILPSFAKDEIYRLQVVAFPTDIHYFPNAEAYEETIPPMESGKKFLMGEGAVFPLGFLSGHSVDPKNPQKEIDTDNDDLVAVRGVVKRLHYGYLNEDGDKEIRGYLRCIIDTEYGELEIDHGFDAIAEEERDYIRVGATVAAIVVISGDPANKEYADGLVRDFTNNLRLLRYTFINGDPERLRLVLADDAEYSLDSNGKTYKGKDEIINRIRYVQEHGNHKYYVHMATIESVDGPVDEGMYPEGTRCLVLTNENEDEYESIGFMEVNEEGYIAKIHTSMDGRYHFKVDTFEDAREELVLPETYHECMITRARYHNFHDDNTDIVLEKVSVEDEDKAAVERIISIDTAKDDLMDGEIAENVFGYIFTKGLIAAAKSKSWTAAESSVCPFEGKIEIEATEELKKKIEYALKYGKQFYNDFNNYNPATNYDDYFDAMNEAMKYVHALGRYCSDSFLK